MLSRWAIQHCGSGGKGVNRILIPLFLIDLVTLSSVITAAIKLAAAVLPWDIRLAAATLVISWMSV